MKKNISPFPVESESKEVNSTLKDGASMIAQLKTPDEIRPTQFLKTEGGNINEETVDNHNEDFSVFDNDVTLAPLSYIEENNQINDVSTNETKRKRKSESRMQSAIKFIKSVDSVVSSVDCEISSINETLNHPKDNEDLYNGNFQLENQQQSNLWGVNNLNDNWDNSWEPEQLLEVPLEEVPYYMTGFPNPPGENRCWLNATLHILFILPLIDHLGDFVVTQCSKLTKTLIALQVFWKQCPGEKTKTYQTIKKFKEELAILDESYPSQKQQDVSEFLMIFLNYVKSECEERMAIDIKSKKQESFEEFENMPEIELIENGPKIPPTLKNRPPLVSISPVKQINNNVTDNWKKDKKLCNAKTPQSTNSSNANNPIDDFFLLHMKEHYYCQSCSNHRERDVDNLMLYVDLPIHETGTVDLAQAIVKSMDVEERSLACSKCKYGKHDVSTTFRNCPSILIVQINRYGMTSDGIVEKVNTAVEVPEQLILENTDEDGLAHRFEPVGLIAHVGSAMDCGHYTSYVKHDDQWFHYNDMDVTRMLKCDALKAAQTTVYLAFFVNVSLLAESSSHSVTLDNPLR